MYNFGPRIPERRTGILVHDAELPEARLRIRVQHAGLAAPRPRIVMNDAEVAGARQTFPCTPPGRLRRLPR
jgi:hypothetical protein